MACLDSTTQSTLLNGDFDKAIRYGLQSITEGIPKHQIEPTIKKLLEKGDFNSIGMIMTVEGFTHLINEGYEEAIPPLFQANIFFKKVGSSKVEDTTEYLNTIIERIGKARFQEIVSKLG